MAVVHAFICFAVYSEHDVFPAGLTIVGPVVIGEDFCVEGKFGEQEISHGAGDASVIIAS